MAGSDVAVLIRSYRRDFGWLRYCLTALHIFLTGVNEIVVVIPRSSQPWLGELGRLPASVRVSVCADLGDDYLGQQVTKMLADTYVDADFICHFDSDCILDAPVHVSTFMWGGRPTVAVRSRMRYERLPAWIEPAERFLGWSLPFDYMCRPPFVYPRWLYPRLREHSQHRHGQPAERYIMAQPIRGFSEFNALGGYADRFHHQSFHWIDADGDAAWPCRWYWSWGGIDDQLRAELDAITGLRRS